MTTIATFWATLAKNEKRALLKRKMMTFLLSRVELLSKKLYSQM